MGNDVLLLEKNVTMSSLGLNILDDIRRVALRILRISDSPNSLNPDHKSSVGRGGHRIDGSRNLWSGSGLKMESVSTDVAWGRGSQSSSRTNGDANLIHM